jgi:predicted TIM-barrel fold metal-dependent hydrolase
MDRRAVLKLAMSLAATRAAGAVVAPHAPTPILDCHIHLFDPTRVGGVPWPLPDDSVLYQPALPGRYEQVVHGLGVVGAIAIEASPLESDNDWVLKQVEANPMMVGMVGDLVPGTPSFAASLDRLHGNSFFLGIRYGNLWDRDLFADRGKPEFVADLRRLAGAGLSLGSANPDGRLIEGLLGVSQQVPDLRIVIDHLPNAKVPAEADKNAAYWSNLRALGQNPRVFMKLSEVPVRDHGDLHTDVADYREKLDRLWEIFGENRILFGSDWPNSDHVASYAETLGIVRSYVAEKGAKALENYFWRNSIAAYRWKPRRPDQRLG